VAAPVIATAVAVKTVVDVEAAKRDAVHAESDRKDQVAAEAAKVDELNATMLKNQTEAQAAADARESSLKSLPMLQYGDYKITVPQQPQPAQQPMNFAPVLAVGALAYLAFRRA